MFAVIETGSNQYKVWEGGEFDIEKLEQAEGDTVVFDKVLLLSKDDAKAIIDTASLTNAKVTATVLKQFRDEKLIIFKMKRRKTSKRYHGHRQYLTRVKITKIEA